MEEAPRRLKQRREFLLVARAGRKFAAPGLVLQALKRRGAATSDAIERRDDDEIRVGFTVTRKIGDAVVRNRQYRERPQHAFRLSGCGLSLYCRFNRGFTDLI